MSASWSDFRMILFSASCWSSQVTAKREVLLEFDLTEQFMSISVLMFLLKVGEEVRVSVLTIAEGDKV